MSMARKQSGVLALAAVAALVGACREQEQDRPLRFEPHVYRGDKPAALTRQQQLDLQERGKLQR
jgi:hypothetical protein